MANLKISQLTSGTAQAGDYLPIARSGANYKVTAQSIAAQTGYLDLDLTAVVGTLTLTDVQASAHVIRLNGTPSGPITIKWPSGLAGTWVVENFTSFVHTLTTTDVGASTVDCRAQVQIFSEGSLDVPGMNYVVFPNSWNLDFGFITGKPPAGGVRITQAVNNSQFANQIVLKTDGSATPSLLANTAATSNQDVIIEAQPSVGPSAGTWVHWATGHILAGGTNFSSITYVAPITEIPFYFRATFPSPQDATLADVSLAIYGSYATTY